uniref:Secreted protein n=1 Tax=Steinernema glaseri TaxID=37863 RepID=A0A1I8ALW5_9BILA
MLLHITLEALVLFSIVGSGGAASTTTKTVPNTDKTLLDLIYKKGYLSTNDKFPSTEKYLWLPIDRRFNAHVLQVIDPRTKKTYSTYTYQTKNARSLCEKKETNNLQKCTVPTLPTQIQECFTTLAWFDGDWASIEVESQCALKRNPRL